MYAMVCHRQYFVELSECSCIADVYWLSFSRNLPLKIVLSSFGTVKMFIFVQNYRSALCVHLYEHMNTNANMNEWMEEKNDDHINK